MTLQEASRAVAFSVEWAHTEDVTMAWLEILAAFVARERIRPPGRGKLPALPSPGRGFVRDLPMTWGEKCGEDDPLPENWEAAVETLTRQMRRAVDLRWRGVLAFQEAIVLGGEAFGHDVVITRVREAVAALRAKVLDLHQAMQPFVTFDLPELTPEEHQQASEYFDLAVLGSSTGTQGPRERMWPARLAEVEAEEAILATDLRAEQEAS